MTWLALGLAALAVSCALEKKELDSSELDWLCSEYPEACRCKAPSELFFGDQRPEFEPTQCDYRGCCYLIEREEPGILARCECVQSEESCDAVASGQGGTVVEQCPPGAPTAEPPPVCAAEGEQCDRDYLEAHELEGCCDGRLCLLEDRTGKRVCRSGDAETNALYGECTSALEAGLESDLSLATPTIETSQGTFTFDRVESVVGRLGEGGCLRRLDVTVAGPGKYCWISVGTELDGLSGLTVDRFETEVGECPGFKGQDNSFHDLDGTPFDLTYEGLACEALESGELCYTGAFTYHLDGAIRDGDHSMVFEQQALVLTGTICGQPFGNGCQ